MYLVCCADTARKPKNCITIVFTARAINAARAGGLKFRCHEVVPSQSGDMNQHHFKESAGHIQYWYCKGLMECFDGSIDRKGRIERSEL